MMGMRDGMDRFAAGLPAGGVGESQARGRDGASRASSVRSWGAS